uniref:Putative AC transposase n=2 Tax=Anthurium amnicola TaxID=1678845 RepID=A0A1D1YIR7_9ARAE
MVGTIDADPLTIEAPAIARRRRKKSLVWEHFTVEAVAGGCTRALCKRCKQTFAYSSGTKIAGTSHLKRHITMGSCPKIREERRQQLALTSGGNCTDPPSKRRCRSSSLIFDQDRSCEDLAKMITMQEFPLHLVEHPAFTSFVQGLQPRFRMPTFETIESEILSIYQKEKQNLMQLFSSIPGRVSLTIGLWTTAQTLGCVCLTGHFIDNEWKLHKRMLNFMMVTSPHSENALSEVIGFSLSDWNMKTKLFTITLDNYCSSHDIYSANLRDHLSNKNTLMLKGQLFVVRCYAHILNVVAQDVLASIHGIVYNIRESLKYVKATTRREEKFAEIFQQLQIPSTKSLTLDIQSHWSTTYLMLAGAFEFREAFASLESCDPNYNEAPSPDDWRKVETVCTYLKLFYDSANAIMGAAEPTANIYFHEVWKIQLELARATTSKDNTVCSIAKEMHEKFDKYWKDCSLVLAIALVMDPRFKMKLVEFSFTKIYGDDAARYIKVVNDGVHDLYFEYIAQPLPLTPAFVEQQSDANNPAVPNNTGVTATTDAMDTTPPSSHANMTNLQPVASDGATGTTAAVGSAAVTNGSARVGGTASTGDRLLDFDIYISEMGVNQQTKCELDQYLEESLVPRIQGFEILSWWKLNDLKYPTLSKLARDVLAIPMSIVPMGSMFSTGSGSRLLDEYRSSLQPETVEALFCSKDWLQYVPTMADGPSTAIVKMEF